MAKRKPRIADEDFVTEDDLVMGGLEGEWVRSPLYEKGHKVARDGTMAICGRTLVPPAGFWEEFTDWIARAMAPMKTNFPDWYLAIDRRKSDNTRCSSCKNTKDMFELLDPMGEPRPEVFTGREDIFTPHPLTPADRLQRQRFLTKVAWVARELGAEIVAAEDHAA